MNGTPYHKSCFKCTHGGCTISPSNYVAHEGRLYCRHHHTQLIKEKGNLSQLEGDHNDKEVAAWVLISWSVSYMSPLACLFSLKIPISLCLWHWTPSILRWNAWWDLPVVWFGYFFLAMQCHCRCLPLSTDIEYIISWIVLALSITYGSLPLSFSLLLADGCYIQLLLIVQYGYWRLMTNVSPFKGSWVLLCRWYLHFHNLRLDIDAVILFIRRNLMPI